GRAHLGRAAGRDGAAGGAAAENPHARRGTAGAVRDRAAVPHRAPGAVPVHRPGRVPGRRRRGDRPRAGRPDLAEPHPPGRRAAAAAPRHPAAPRRPGARPERSGRRSRAAVPPGGLRPVDGGAALRHPRPVRLLTVRLIAVVWTLTWWVVPGFGVIDLSVTWDPGWP